MIQKLMMKYYKKIKFSIKLNKINFFTIRFNKITILSWKFCIMLKNQRLYGLKVQIQN